MGFITQTAIGRVFGIDAHAVSQYLIKLNLKKDSKPTSPALKANLCIKQGKIWLWDGDEVIKKLQTLGLKKNRRVAKSENKTKLKKKQAYTAFTDGSDTSYAVVLFDQKNIKHYVAGKHPKIEDSNRSELIAVKELLEVIPKGKTITIFTDSLYVRNKFNKLYLDELSSDILISIKNLIKAKNLKITCTWIKSHSGIHGNEEADSLAQFVKSLLI